MAGLEPATVVEAHAPSNKSFETDGGRASFSRLFLAVRLCAVRPPPLNSIVGRIRFCMVETEDMTKVKFHEGKDVETLWAFPLGGNLYRLDSSPFFAYRVSWLDIVEAEPDDEGVLSFVRVVEKSGNRTVRVITEGYETTSKEAKPFLEGIIDLGCSYEGFQPRLLSITVPAEIELKAVANYLIKSNHNWEYADPTYDDLFPES